MEAFRKAKEAKQFPMIVERGDTIPWYVAELAHKVYSKKHDQSLERIAERGGFGTLELAVYLYDRIKELEEEVTDLKVEQMKIMQLSLESNHKLKAEVEWQKKLNNAQGESVEVLRQKVLQLCSVLEQGTAAIKLILEGDPENKYRAALTSMKMVFEQALEGGG